VRPPEFETLALAYRGHIRFPGNDKASVIIRAEEPTAPSQPGDGAITPAPCATQVQSLDRARIDHTHTMR
jgi:hypothetical protein